MPELTVSMPAHNSGKFIREAIRSVLSQEGVDLELIVVDDGSSDDTIEIVLSFSDPRIKLLRNEKNRGIAYCHNRVIDESSSPFISHVDSDDIIRKDALAKMLDCMKRSPDVCQAHCYFMAIDEDGHGTREMFHKKYWWSLRNVRKDMDYQDALLEVGPPVINMLRTYRKSVFSIVGKFNENIRCGEDYEMALRIADIFNITAVPEFLYFRREHASNTTPSTALTLWRQRVGIVLSLLISGRAPFLRKKLGSIIKYVIFRSLLTDLSIYYRLRGLIRRTRVRMRRPSLKGIYVLMYNALSSLKIWPVDLFYRKRKVAGVKRIAYYFWKYPLLSEMFIVREIEALRSKNIDILCISEEMPEDYEIEKTRDASKAGVLYLKKLNRKLFYTYAPQFFFRNPVKFINLYLYVISTKYSAHKHFELDKHLLGQAVHLAAVLKKGRVSHIHTPWARRQAFIALLASRLLNIPYSVQPRADEIYKHDGVFDIDESLRHADFVVTNCRFNKECLDNRLKLKSDIVVVYEGVDPSEFDPGGRGGDVPRILTVARAVEEKGIEYLFEACRILKDKGFNFQCDIIGDFPLGSNGYCAKLKVYYYRLGHKDCVFLRGSLPFNKVLGYYKKSDIFVLPSVGDVTPHSIMEAMAMKLPVVSTTVRGIPEIVKDGLTGILVPPSDPRALADAIARLMDDPSLRRQMGEAGRKRVEEKFNMNRNVLKYMDLFGAQGKNQERPF